VPAAITALPFKNDLRDVIRKWLFGYNKDLRYKSDAVLPLVSPGSIQGSAGSTPGSTQHRFEKRNTLSNKYQGNGRQGKGEDLLSVLMGG
jgi:hypothetical protein